MPEKKHETEQSNKYQLDSAMEIKARAEERRAVESWKSGGGSEEREQEFWPEKHKVNNQ